MDATQRDDIMTALADATDVPDPPSLTLLRTLLDEDHAINRKSLCGLWGIKPSTLGHMLRGDIHISIERWAALFEELRDERILRLLVDPRRYAVYSLPEVGREPDKAGIAHAFFKLKREHDAHAIFVERLLGILEDLRVDGDDAELIADLRHVMPEYISTVLAAATHVDAMYERWCERQGGGGERKAVGR